MDDLEAGVAAVVWRDGPMSAYRVREEFRASLSRVWSSSAGTIYPVIRRLVERGLLAATCEQDKRGTQQLQITGAGRKAVREWLLDGASEQAEPAADASRVRLQFMGLVSSDQVDNFIHSAAEASEKVLLRLVDSFHEKSDGEWLEFLSMVGAAMQVHARLKWLQLVSRGRHISADERPAFLDELRAALTLGERP